MINIVYTYGKEQRFRRRTNLITIRGHIEQAAHPVSKAARTLNGGDRKPFYVEDIPDDGVDWTSAYKDTPAELRCRNQGEFCIEIPVDEPALLPGGNVLDVETTDAAGNHATATMVFDWNPDPAPFPVDLRDLSRFSHVQELGEVINGAFDIDHDLNVIRSRAPVAPDALLLVGSPGQSQEATYCIKFLDFAGAKWMGCGDFFAGIVDGVPPRGIKVGWCSAGMAAINPVDGARSFLAWGDHSGDEREWAIATHPARQVSLQINTLYRVRHRVSFHENQHRVRWRIWPAGQDEPQEWLCDEDTGQLPTALPRHKSATFGLFQHFGMPVEWSEILVRQIKDDPSDLPCQDPSRSRRPFLKRDRPGAF